MGKYKDISDLIYSALSGYAPLVALLSNGVDSIYPVIADANEGESFVIYHIEYRSIPSKDAVYHYSITVHSWAKKYNDAIAIADEVTGAFGAAADRYIEGDGKPQFNEQEEFYIEQTFNIKK